MSSKKGVFLETIYDDNDYSLKVDNSNLTPNKYYIFRKYGKEE